jgi:hypothetical protein
MNTETQVSIAIAFISSFVACEVTHHVRHIERGRYARLTVATVIGFSGMLLTMMLFSAVSSFRPATALIVGLGYGFIMANAKAFENLR